MLEAAHTWLNGGFSVIPVRTDGTKRPVFDWKRFTQERPKPEALNLWWSENANLGIGVVCGAVSGNLEMLELEGRTGGLGVFGQITEAITTESAQETWLSFLDYGFVEQSPSGGVHFLYRIADHEVPGNTKIANRPSNDEELALNPKQKVQTLAETRGEGGFVVVAPSGGTVHKSGRSWTVLDGSDIGWVPTISWEDRCAIHDAIHRVLDQMPEDVRPEPLKPSTTFSDSGDLRPGDDYNNRTTWEEILEPHGWTRLSQRGDRGEILWVRPGKEARDGHSASTGYANDEDRLFVWSSSTEFNTETPYTKFAAYALLEHRNDYAAASRELRKRGYGSTRVSSPFSAASGPSSAKDAVTGELVPQAAPMNDWDTVVTNLKELESDTLARKAYCRSVIGSLGVLDAAQTGNWRDLLCGVGGLGRREFDAIMKDAQREAVRSGRLASNPNAVILPSASDPMQVARELARRIKSTDNIAHLKRWRDNWYEWTGAHWQQTSDSSVQSWLYAQTEDALCEGASGLEKWKPNRSKIGDLAHALGVGVVYRDDNDESERYLACLNGVFDTKTLTLLPHSPARFNLYSVPFDYDHKAECPQWMTFLSQILPGDIQAQQCLQEWFGYVISGRTDLQKMLSLVGDKRSGKGTVSRILRRLIGADVVANPTLRTLSGDFGLEDLIGKSLAIMGDVRWEGRGTGGAVEALLGIIGEDAKTVHRKNQLSWHGQMDTRFMLMSNDSPQFSDASLALSGRMVHIHFKQSFFGREDTGLTERLYEEMPGILNWALEGLDRLNKRGRFAEADSSRGIRDEVEEIASPVRAFMVDHTEPAEGERVEIGTLYAVYSRWCAEQGQEHCLRLNTFSRAIRSSCRDMGVEVSDRERDPAMGRKVRHVIGVRLANWVTPPATWASGAPGGRNY